jgi:hypothetical protein
MSEPTAQPSEIWGLMAEFDNATALMQAAHKTHGEGYRQADAFSPIPIEGLSEALGFHRSRIPLLVLLGALAGALGGYFMQYFASVIHYPVNIGGRPMHSWPAFIPITFEAAVLTAALVAVFGMIVLNGLPQPYHPVFNVPQFQLASRDRFFLVIQASDPQFELAKTRAFMESLAPLSIAEVPH